MNNSGKTTRSAPAAAVRARLTFSAFPAMSPTVELSCAIAIASLSMGRVLMANLYRLAGLPSNGQSCKAASTKSLPEGKRWRYPSGACPAYTAKQSRGLPSGCAQSRAATTQRHRTGWLEIASIKVKGLQALLDHALDHHGLVILAEGRTLTPMSDLGLCRLSVTSYL